MFCPKCATQNLEGASFCRTCGANISLVPQALTGQLAEPPDELVDNSCSPRRRRRKLTPEIAFKNLFMGVAFVIVAIALSRTIGATWWFWLLIPAFLMMSTGVGQFVRLKEREKRIPLAGPRTQTFPPRINDQQPALGRRTDELRPPVPSVTEGTTRHLGVEAPTRHLETHERK